jgi:hypothetical protein
MVVDPEMIHGLEGRFSVSPVDAPFDLVDAPAGSLWPSDEAVGSEGGDRNNDKAQGGSEFHFSGLLPGRPGRPGCHGRPVRA